MASSTGQKRHNVELACPRPLSQPIAVAPASFVRASGYTSPAYWEVLLTLRLTLQRAQDETDPSSKKSQSQLGLSRERQKPVPHGEIDETA
jgi:hypothetical protein